MGGTVRQNFFFTDLPIQKDPSFPYSAFNPRGIAVSVSYLHMEKRMSSSKNHSPHTRDREPIPNPQNIGSRPATTGRPASTSKGPIVKPSVRPTRSQSPLPKPLPQPARGQPRLAKPGPQPAQMHEPTAKPGAQTVHAHPLGAKQVRETPSAANRPLSGNSKAGARVSKANVTNAPPTATKRTTAWTIEAASRIASVTAKRGDGTVKKGSLAADAMSRAMKHERDGKLEK